MNKLIAFFLFSTFISLSIRAQDSTLTDKALPDSSIDISLYPQKDIIDIGRRILKKNDTSRVDENIHRSTKPHLSAIPALGYTLQTDFAIVLSANLAFHASLEKAQKLSSILSSVTYTQYRQLIFPIQASIWTKGNKYNIVTDWRYMKYPSLTYGLGKNNPLSRGYWLDFSYLKIHQVVFREVTKNLYAGAGYYYDYFWNVKSNDIPDSSMHVFHQYGLQKHTIASGLALRILYDSRLNQVNSDNGWMVNLQYRPNYTWLGSDQNWQSMLLDIRKFIRLSKKHRHVLALWSYNWLTTGGNPPYLLLPSTGWDDYVNTGRGYIQGRFRGRNMFYFETEYRFDITRNGLFGGVLFANAQTFNSYDAEELKNIAPAAGFGLRLKLNKFSGSNLCIDYGFGANGSRGFFVNLSEVF